MSIVNFEKQSGCECNTLHSTLITLQKSNEKLKLSNEILSMKIQNLEEKNKILLAKINKMSNNSRRRFNSLTINDLNGNNEDDSRGESIFSDESTQSESFPNTSDINFISGDYSTDRTYHLTEDDVEEEEIGEEEVEEEEEEEEEEKEKEDEKEDENEDKRKEQTDDETCEVKAEDDNTYHCYKSESSNDVEMITKNISDIEI